MLSRRTFLESLGLGAAGALLAPMVAGLHAHAQGLPPRKRFLVFMDGTGMDIEHFLPPQLVNEPGFHPQAQETSLTTAFQSRAASTFTLPNMLKSFAPYKDRMLFVDGLGNSQYDGGAGTHTAMHCALSCVPPTSDVEGALVPGGITFDQHLGNLLGQGYPYKAIGLGAIPDYHYERSSVTTALASGANMAIPHITSPKVAAQRYFGMVTSMPDPAAVKRQAKQRLLFDFMREDLKRLQVRLAAPEKNKLDEYLSSLEAVEQRLQAAPVAGCVPPAGPFYDAAYPTTHGDNAKISAMTDIATAALICGLAPVVTLNAFTGPDFDTSNFSQVPGVRTHTLGHEEGLGLDGLDLIHDFHASLVVRAAQRLEAVTEGNGTMLDNTVILFTNDNGGRHHQGQHRWPTVLLGNAGARLKMDGRYLKYPLAYGDAGKRGLGELYRTIEQAITGSPSSFGARSLVPVNGPLAEVLS